MYLPVPATTLSLALLLPSSEMSGENWAYPAGGAGGPALRLYSGRPLALLLEKSHLEVSVGEGVV